jgi:hypothetical protein
MKGNTPVILILCGIIAATGAFVGMNVFGSAGSFSDTEAGFDESVTPEPEEPVEPPWVRPEGPPKVGLQVGHWRVAEVPEELENLKYNTGAYGGGKAEWEVGFVIAEKTKALLEPYGIEVEILPTTVPPGYWADAFVSIHSDGNPNSAVSGYKLASPRRDRSGRAARLAEIIERTYGDATDLPLDPNVTRNMRGYYAFNWRRYEHAIHRMTPGAILETGFLTSPRDRKILIGAPEISAKGLADGIVEFLREDGLLADPIALR